MFFSLFPFALLPELIPGVFCELPALIVTLLPKDPDPMENAKLFVAVFAVLIAIFSTLIAIVSLIVNVTFTRRLKMVDIANERRRLFITTLWDKLVAVKSINAKNANGDRVSELFNSLELVAFCWQEEIADRKLIARAFGKSYGERVKEIQGITRQNGYNTAIDDLGMTGTELLSSSSRIELVLLDIQRELARG